MDYMKSVRNIVENIHKLLIEDNNDISVSLRGNPTIVRYSLFHICPVYNSEIWTYEETPKPINKHTKR